MFFDSSATKAMCSAWSRMPNLRVLKVAIEESFSLLTLAEEYCLSLVSACSVTELHITFNAFINDDDGSIDNTCSMLFNVLKLLHLKRLHFSSMDFCERLLHTFMESNLVDVGWLTDLSFISSCDEHCGLPEPHQGGSQAKRKAP